MLKFPGRVGQRVQAIKHPVCRSYSLPAFVRSALRSRYVKVMLAEGRDSPTLGGRLEDADVGKPVGAPHGSEKYALTA